MILHGLTLMRSELSKDVPSLKCMACKEMGAEAIAHSVSMSNTSETPLQSEHGSHQIVPSVPFDTPLQDPPMPAVVTLSLPSGPPVDAVDNIGSAHTNPTPPLVEKEGFVNLQVSIPCSRFCNMKGFGQLVRIRAAGN